MVTRILILAMLLGGTAFSKDKVRKYKLDIPLMGPKTTRSLARRSRYKRRTRVKTRYRRRRRSSRRNPALSVQAGVMTQKASAGDSFLGLNGHLGARIAVAYPWRRTFSIEPLLGYYYDQNGLASVSFKHHWFETGANLLYIMRASRKTQVKLGVAPRLDFRFNRISALNNSGGGSALQLGLRLGPTAGLATRIGRKLQFTLNVELTFDFTKQFNPHPAALAGFAFPL